MKKERIFLLISLVGIIVLLALANTSSPKIVGKITHIKANKESTSIRLNDSNLTIIILNKTILNVKENCNVKIFGNLPQNNTLFADKIIATKC